MDALESCRALSWAVEPASGKELLTCSLLGGVRGALVVLDVSSVRNVVDKRGIAAGDKALRTIAGSLRERVRETDAVARISSDEVAVVCPATGHGEAQELVEQLREVVADATAVEGASPPAVSARVAIFPDDGEDAASLLDNTVQALAE